MLLETPVRTLGPVNHRPLKDAVSGLTPNVRLEDTSRQKSFEKHKQTQSVVMLLSSTWPDPAVEKRSGWNHFSGPANALTGEIAAEHHPPGGRIIRAMTAKLLAGGRIRLHKDAHGLAMWPF